MPFRFSRFRIEFGYVCRKNDNYGSTAHCLISSQAFLNTKLYNYSDAHTQKGNLSLLFVCRDGMSFYGYYILYKYTVFTVPFHFLIWYTWFLLRDFICRQLKGSTVEFDHPLKDLFCFSKHLFENYLLIINKDRFLLKKNTNFSKKLVPST